MKKFILLVVTSLAIVCSFSSCSKDNETNNKENNQQFNPLVGTWSNADGGWIYTFNADYTYSEIFVEEASGYKGITNGTYAIQGDILYFIEEKYECGLALHGTEVKSLRMGKCSIKEAFIRIENGEVFAYSMHISPYEKGNIFNKDPLRVKKLLLHKQEINKLLGKIKEKGYTLVPLQVYFSNGKAKIEIGLARGKKLYDKREDIARKDQRRETEREFKVKNLY